MQLKWDRKEKFKIALNCSDPCNQLKWLWYCIQGLRQDRGRAKYNFNPISFEIGKSTGLKYWTIMSWNLKRPLLRSNRWPNLNTASHYPFIKWIVPNNATNIAAISTNISTILTLSPSFPQKLSHLLHSTSPSLTNLRLLHKPLHYCCNINMLLSGSTTSIIFKINIGIW